MERVENTDGAAAGNTWEDGRGISSEDRRISSRASSSRDNVDTKNIKICISYPKPISLMPI